MKGDLTRRWWDRAPYRSLLSEFDGARDVSERQLTTNIRDEMDSYD